MDLLPEQILRCRFSELNMNLEPEVNNYLDDYTNPSTGRTYCKGDDKDIIERITETYENWGVYGILHYNCEHLATYVRYGVKIAVQVSGQRVINSIYLFKKHFVCPVFTKIMQLLKINIHCIC